MPGPLQIAREQEESGAFSVERDLFAVLGGSREKEIEPFLALSSQSSGLKQAKVGHGSPAEPTELA